MTSPVREVRLKPEYAVLYPGLEPGVWVAAAMAAEHILARIRTLHDPVLLGRVLDERHFEFRGGADGLRPADARERLTDR